VGITLDAGALIAIERNDRTIAYLLRRALEKKVPIVIPVGVLGQVWRDGRTQARLARFLATDDLELEVLDAQRARLAGQLCGVTRTSDVIDASVVVGAKLRGDRIVTSDPDDLSRLDASITLIVV
jgi:hypothetical protein